MEPIKCNYVCCTILGILAVTACTDKESETAPLRTAENDNTSSVSDAVEEDDSDSDGDADRKNSDNNDEENTRAGGDADEHLAQTNNEPGDGSINKCAGVTEDAQSVRLPADIIIAVDNSGSMIEEVGFVRENLNRLLERVGDLDVHIVLISARNGDAVPHNLDQLGDRIGDIITSLTPGICVDPPLGKEGACPDNDESNPPKFKHIDHIVGSGSNDGLRAILQTYSQWKNSLREGAPLHIVLVSDDNAFLMTADGFTDSLSDLSTPAEDFTFHAIVATSNPGNGGPCNKLAAARGTVYEELVQKTKGVLGNLCEQKFTPVFDAISDSMISSTLSCEWKIPEPPKGETFDTNEVNVQFTSSKGKVHNIGWVPGSDECSKVEHGWYYNKEKNPTKVIVCGQTCEWIQRKDKGNISITFGCETIVATIV